MTTMNEDQERYKDQSGSTDHQGYDSNMIIKTSMGIRTSRVQRAKGWGKGQG